MKNGKKLDKIIITTLIVFLLLIIFSLKIIIDTKFKVEAYESDNSKKIEENLNNLDNIKNKTDKLDKTNDKDYKIIDLKDFDFVKKNLEENGYKSIYVMINKKNFLPSDYEPDDLIIPNIDFPFKEIIEKKYMRKEAAHALEKLCDMGKENGVYIYGISGYRSYKRQKELYDRYVAKDGQKAADTYSAKPGSSEHQSGLVMDVSDKSMNFELDESFSRTKTGKFIEENAHKCGFIVRYKKNKEHITKYVFEPWHLRYVGEKVATYIYEHDLSYEEFFDRLNIDYNK